MKKLLVILAFIMLYSLCSFGLTACAGLHEHVFSTYVSNNDATFYRDGTKTAVCDVDGCNETDTIVDENSKLVEISTDVFIFASETIKGLTEYGKTLDKIYIPETIYGVTVTRIGASAFYDCDSLVSIEMPNSVTRIGASAFYSCDSLTSIEIPNSVTSIGDSAFFGCVLLTSIEIPNSVTSIENYTFSNCNSLTSVTIGDNVGYIGGRAFGDCSSLTNVIIGDNVDTIRSYAFAYCSSLTNIKIPTSVTYIESGVFIGCSSLEEIEIPFVGEQFGTSKYQYPFGCIFGTGEYDGGMKTTQKYYENERLNTGIRVDYYIPSSLKSVTISGGDIFYGAFTTCLSLTSVIIGDNVTSIGDNAFCHCRSLTNVTIGKNVTSIGSYAFDNCYILNTITYKGSVSEWKKIKKGYNWDYKIIGYKVVCSDGIVYS